ncbi:porin [Acetonema longum]|uniref:Porin domain-containing protein n=1 Tax=Acetonema longum DSM 6540 TaxID=1009370 RepID=F7NDG7_9FIRM|nr:porin [Acetonema longum]EGO65920.1 hypothetical protein ALO_00370 [Acetonema longum DSM 6540]
MQKKLLTAAILASLTLSATAAFAAAPTLSGDARIEYRNEDASDNHLTNRIRLNVDAQIDDTFYVHGRARYDNDMRENNGGVMTFDQAYIGAAMENADLRVGRQSLSIGQGLLMDDDNFSGAQLNTAINNLNVKGFYGKDPSDTKTSFIDLGTSFRGLNIGGSYLKEDDKYYGFNLGANVAPNVALNVEVAKNDTQDANGFLAEVAIGQAVKKGDFLTAISYRDVDEYALTPFSTDGAYDNSKGFRIKGAYKVSDTATLTAYQDIAEDQDGADKDRTNVEFSVNF